MIKRKTYSFRGGDILDIEEYHDGRYGAPGLKRMKRRKATKEDMLRVNKWNKEKRCRQRLLQYFKETDLFLTWTYSICLLYTSPSPRDMRRSRMPSSA